MLLPLGLHTDSFFFFTSLAIKSGHETTRGPSPLPKNFPHAYVKMFLHLHLLCNISHFLLLSVNSFPLRFSPPLIPSPLLLLISHLSSVFLYNAYISHVLKSVQNKQHVTREARFSSVLLCCVCHQLWAVSPNRGGFVWTVQWDSDGFYQASLWFFKIRALT